MTYEGEQEEDQACRTPKLPVDPGRPTAKEFMEHRALHWPFRSWCPHCVRAKAVSAPHPGKKGLSKDDDLEETGATTVSMEYCFSNEGGGKDKTTRVRSPASRSSSWLKGSRLAFTRCRRRRAHRLG